MHKNMHLYSAGKVASFYYTTVAYVFKHMFGKVKETTKIFCGSFALKFLCFLFSKFYYSILNNPKSRGIKACEL